VAVRSGFFRFYESEFSHSIHLKDEDTFSHCKFIVSLCQSDVKDNTLLTIFKRIPLHLDENGNNVIVNTIIYKISSEMLSQEEFMKMKEYLYGQSDKIPLWYKELLNILFLEKNVFSIDITPNLLLNSCLINDVYDLLVIVIQHKEIDFNKFKKTLNVHLLNTLNSDYLVSHFESLKYILLELEKLPSNFKFTCGSSLLKNVLENYVNQMKLVKKIKPFNY
jgi:hypothetical protein